MELLTEKQEEGLFFLVPFFAVHSIMYDKEECRIYKTYGPCFGHWRHSSGFITASKKSKYIDVFFPDLLMPIIKKSAPKYKVDLTLLYLKALSDAGITKSVVSVKFLSVEEMKELKVIDGNVSCERYERGVCVRFDTTITSVREIFFVASWVREIAEHPAFVYNFFKLHEAVSERPVWETLYIAYGIPMFKNFKIIQSHSVVSSNFLFIKKSPEEYFKFLNKEPLPFTSSTNYQVPVSPDYVMDVEDREYTSFVHRPYVSFSLSAYDSFLSKENYLSWKRKSEKLFQQPRGF